MASRQVCAVVGVLEGSSELLLAAWQLSRVLLTALAMVRAGAEPPLDQHLGQKGKCPFSAKLAQQRGWPAQPCVVHEVPEIRSSRGHLQ